LSREGGNIAVVVEGRTLAATDGPYAGASIYQDYFEIPTFDGLRPVIGSWSVDGEPAGMGVREDGMITGNLARFVPHIVV
jgi:glutathionylspermidine synthase